MRFAWVLFAFLFCFPICVSAKNAPLNVVVSFSVLADFTKQVGGDRVQVISLVAAGQDAHVFEPTPRDAKTLASADLVIVNGLGFEGWLSRLVKSSGYQGVIVEASKHATVLTEDAAHHEHDHAHEGSDPHAWQEVAQAKRYIETIRDALMARDPSHAAQYYEQAKTYLSALDNLDKEIRSAWNTIPEEKRKIITSHDAFGYYARAYDVTFLAPLGLSSDSDASAKQIAMLIEQIRNEQVKALFVENITNARLIEQIRNDTGLALGGTLYSDALSDASGPASTYLDMMRHNTKLMISALGY